MSTLPNRCLGYSTYDVEEVKIRRPRRAQRDSAAKQLLPPAGELTPRIRGWRGLPRKDWRKWQGMKLRYSHGADPHVIVEARGRTWSYAWDTAVLDILRDVCNR